MAKEEASRITSILKVLKDEYPEPKPELVFSTPFELLVATMLSAQCTDKQVNKCTALLFAEYNTPGQIASMSEAQLEPYIQRCGLYKTKCKNIISTSRILTERFNGSVPMTREELMTLPGVGRKTANVVLSNAFHLPAIAVDTHVFRVANRIGLVDASNVGDTEEQLMRIIPESDWGDAHHWLIFHGRRVCGARSPQCASCVIKQYCRMGMDK